MNLFNTDLPKILREKNEAIKNERSSLLNLCSCSMPYARKKIKNTKKENNRVRRNTITNDKRI